MGLAERVEGIGHAWGRGWRLYELNRPFLSSTYCANAHTLAISKHYYLFPRFPSSFLVRTEDSTLGGAYVQSYRISVALSLSDTLSVSNGVLPLGCEDLIHESNSRHDRPFSDSVMCVE